MLAPDPNLIEGLLGSAGVAALRLDAQGAVLEILNEPLLREWIPAEDRAPRAGDSLAAALAPLFDAPELSRLQALLVVPATAGIAALASRSRQRVLQPRYFDIGLLPLPASGEGQRVLTLAEVTERKSLTLALEQARGAHDLALTVLCTDAGLLRTFLREAVGSIGGIRSLLKLPARTPEALREKLGRLQREVSALQRSASDLPLQVVAAPLERFAASLTGLRERDMLSGDDLLPLAVQFDAISTMVAALLSLDEQRANVAPTKVSVRPGLPWHEICEQNCIELVRRCAARHGVLAELRIKGMALVPESYHRAVELALRPLLRNALQHGIEPPQVRVAADKSATGRITVTLRNHGSEGLELTVHDDGRGFDLERVRTAALKSGLGTEEELDAIEPRRLVGYVFRRRFSTAGLDTAPAEDQGVSHLRQSLLRQGGTIAVATKTQRYTMFTIRLPAVSAGATAGSAIPVTPARESRQAMP